METLDKKLLEDAVDYLIKDLSNKPKFTMSVGPISQVGLALICAKEVREKPLKSIDLAGAVILVSQDEVKLYSILEEATRLLNCSGKLGGYLFHTSGWGVFDILPLLIGVPFWRGSLGGLDDHC